MSIAHRNGPVPGTLQIGDMPVHRLGYGAMRLTGKGVWGPPADPENAKKVLHRALDLGVDFIDTSDAYGPNVNEEIIRDALHPYPKQLVIATKGGLTRGGPDEWTPDGRPEHLRAACEGSLERLGTQRIDLYQLHSPDSKVPLEDSLGELVKLQHEGKIRHIGVSNVSVEQLAAAQKVCKVVSVQNRYNVTDRGSEGVLAACDKAGIAFLPWFPLAAGKSLDEGQDALAKIAKARGKTPRQVAIAWLLAHSAHTVPIPGTSSIEHLEENMGAADIVLTPAELATLS